MPELFSYWFSSVHFRWLSRLLLFHDVFIALRVSNLIGLLYHVCPRIFIGQIHRPQTFYYRFGLSAIGVFLIGLSQMYEEVEKNPVIRNRLNLRVLLFAGVGSEQLFDTLNKMIWNHSFEGSYYIWKTESYFLPIYSVDRDWLHLEARYNYEDMNTFSGWFGYNFNGGKKFQYAITPMLGIVAGNSDGIAPGLEFTFGFHGFELYSESEYLFDLNDKEIIFIITGLILHILLLIGSGFN